MAFDAFSGAKVAIIRGQDVLALLRDDKPDIAWPGYWDFPGGGREGDETPFETVARECFEETGLSLPEHRVFYHIAPQNDEGETVHFFAVLWSDLDETQLCLGDEGQELQFWPIHAFLEREDVIPALKTRLRLALTTL